MSNGAKFPAVLQQVADAAGPAAAIKLAKDHGGTRLYIPRAPTPKSVLSRSVGQEAAERIAAALGFGFVNVPLGPRIWDRRVVAAVGELLARKKSVPQIAWQLGITERTVYRCKRVLRGLPPERKLSA